MTDPIQLQGLKFPKDVELNPRHFDIKTEESQDSFTEMLTKAINGVDETMKTSEQNMQDYIAGKTDNVHDVMISMQRAQMSFQMMVEIRNKAVEAYSEISRMQI